MNDGGVVVHVDFLYGHRGDVCDEKAADCVGERRVDADEVELKVEPVLLDDTDLQLGPETFNRVCCGL